jgi:hypothetical protein
MTGRNDLCPCGSGKKYKKCCLLRDQERRPVQLPLPEDEQGDVNLFDSRQIDPKHEVVDTRDIVPRKPILGPVPTPVEPASPKPKPPPDPVMEAIYARWKEFEEAPDSELVDIFLKTLDQPELMDDENAFGMLEKLYGKMQNGDDRDRFDELIRSLREKLPEIYNESKKFYLGWLIENALANHRFDRVRVLAREMAEFAGDEVEVYHWTVDQLAYHGQLTALAEASRIAWPDIKISDDLLWGQSEYAKWGTDCILFERLEKSPEIDGRDPELIEQVRYYYEKLNVERLAEYVTYISGHANRSWSLSDFPKPSAGKSKKSNKKSSAGKNHNSGAKEVDFETSVDNLLNEFIDYAHRQEGVPFTKAALARNSLIEYFTRRESGGLKPKLSMYDAMLHPEKKPPKEPAPDHILCPDCATLERHIGGMLQLFSLQRHSALATFELIPAWLRFLESRGLIDAEQREKTMAEVGELQPTLLKLAVSSPSDPLLAENLKKWPEDPQVPGSV